MTDRCRVAWKQELAIVLWLATAVHTPYGFAGEAAGDNPADQAGAFQYSDDWNIVSAPPPPGPYETVHVDPRVPGQDVARPVPQDFMVTEPAAHMPADPGHMPPPGAGPAVSEASPPMRTRQTSIPPPPAGAYGRQGYGRPPASGYSAPGGYTGRQTYPAYGQGYRRGYGQGYNPGQGYNQGYGYSYPGQYAPSRQQDIPPPPYALMPGR